jgi:class 3 adenylate cyclase
MPAPSFRLKLMLATMTVVAGVTVAALLATQRSVEATYRRLFRERFASEIALFSARRDARLAPVRRKNVDLARSVRLVAAFHEGDAALLYRIALDELREVLAPPPGAPGPRASFFRFVRPPDEILPPADARAGLAGAAGPAAWEREIARGSRALGDEERQRIGYLPIDAGGGAILHEVAMTAVVDPVDGRTLGVLAVGFPIDLAGEEAPEAIRSGIWAGGRLFSATIPEPARPQVAAALTAALAPPPPPTERPRDGGGTTAGGAGPPGGSDDAGEVTLVLGGVPHRLFYGGLETAEAFPPAYQVGLYSLAEALARQRGLRRDVAAFGALALVLGLAMSLVLARSLSGPVEELVAATGEVERGRLDVHVPVRRRDELGRLAGAFNAMTEGLALKERYRRLLDLVADRDVAQELIEGGVALGGEEREVSVLFCDIRGFTALARGRPPGEIVRLLNEHMTALTRVVYAERGVVDKFVGDALMAVFGAPKSTGDDAFHAVRAAAQMVAARAALNAGGGPALAIGVGVASGVVVAGCMGSADRLDYTVLGDQVNLAARLCARARGMEVLLDERTHERLGGRIPLEPVPPLELKGFGAPVAAYRLAGGGVLRPASP